MADLFGIGASALRAAQLALDTTGNNIANVNTEGYSRQRVELATLPSQGAGRRAVGSGVTVTGIERSYSQFAENEVLRYSAGSARHQAYADISARMDRLLGTSGAALSQAVDSVFSALQAVANNPTGIAERQVALGEMQNLSARQASVYGAMENLSLEINGRIRASVEEINGLTEGIARLNDRIVTASAGTRAPNDLLDQRDALIRELSSKVSVTLSEQDDGAVNVYLGSTQALVVGSRSDQLATMADPFDASRLNVAVSGIAGTRDINREITGGELRGLLDVREEILDPAIDQLGQLSLGIAETLNGQNRLGSDLDGNLGGDLFAPVEIPVQGSTMNAGTATPTVAISDATAVRADRYRLDFTAGSWTLTRLSDNQSVTGAGPLQLDGLSIDVSAGAPVDGDSFLIQPGRAGAAGFASSTSNPRALAAAAPLAVEPSLDNAGSAAAGGLTVTDAVDLPLSGPVTLTFNPDALGPGVPGFDVTGGIATTIAYDPNTDSGGISASLGLTGVSFTLSGVPASGDTLTLSNTPAASGDNRNALSLAGLRSQTLLEGGSRSYQDVYGSMLSGVAVKTARADASLEVESALLEQAEANRSSISGVNLDEEAANLLRFQQQYQAAAQIIATADLVFSTLLDAARR